MVFAPTTTPLCSLLVFSQPFDPGFKKHLTEILLYHAYADGGFVTDLVSKPRYH
jgi:hypothetical protein